MDMQEIDELFAERLPLEVIAEFILGTHLQRIRLTFRTSEHAPQERVLAAVEKMRRRIASGDVGGTEEVITESVTIDGETIYLGDEPDG